MAANWMAASGAAMESSRSQFHMTVRCYSYLVSPLPAVPATMLSAAAMDLPHLLR